MTARASQQPSSSAYTSSLAWFCRSGGRVDVLRAGFLAGNAPFTLWGQYSPVSFSLKDISASSRRGCTRLWKSCRALPLPPRGFSSTSTLHGRGSSPRGQCAIQTKHSKTTWGWRESSVGKSTCCSSRRPRFSASRKVVYSGPKFQFQGIPTPFSGLQESQTHTWCIYIHVCCQNTQTHKNKP